MELFNEDITAFRWVFCLAAVAAVLGAERAAPFRTPIQSKLEHVSTNLTIFGGNSLLAQWLAAWTLLIWSSYVSSEGWGLLHSLELAPVPHVLVSIILLDLVGYGIHRCYHRVPFFWRFHRAHHSDLDMDATTSIRFHLGEVIITTGIKGLSVWALGISPAGFLISETLTLVAGLFSHANVRLPSWLEPRLRLAIVTPSMHWIHHSHRPSEHNVNLSAVFSVWDRLFGTYDMRAARHEIEFGLDEYPTLEDVGFLRFFRMPFDRACRAVDQDQPVSASTAAPVNMNR
jgi:sterol desaturase/sphingolipid hydroxylase (fatty acid hydroxylase superfamily)